MAKYATVVFPGDSLMYGSQSTDPMTPALGSGTTSYPYVCANTVSGRGTWLTQNFDVDEIHSYNYGISGRNLRVIVDQFDVEVAPLADGTRTGPFIVIARGIGNTVQGLSYTLAQLRGVAVELRDKVHALGGKLYISTEIDRGAGANGSNANNTGWYLSGPAVGAGLSVHGTTITSFNTDLRVNDGTYCDGFIEHENEVGTHCKINRSVTLACNDITYFNADTVHGQNALYSLMGVVTKTYFDGNDGIFYPVSGLARVGFKLGLGF